jgi:hypothetical protein
MAEFSVTDLGFQGRFSTGLGKELSFLPSLNFFFSHWRPCSNLTHMHLLLPAPQTLYRTEHERLEQAVTRSGFWGCGFCKLVAAPY